MNSETPNMTPEDAQGALNAVQEMERAGWRRAVPPRWISASYAIIVGGSCATFAIEHLQYKGFSYFLLWGLAYVILGGIAVKSGGAEEREFHPPKSRRFSYWSSTLGMLFVGFGSIYLRYELDAGWIAAIGGLINGIWLYLYYETERRQGFGQTSSGEG